MPAFDIAADPAKPELLPSIAMAEGAHRIAFDEDVSIGRVQSSRINLAGTSDGTMTVVDLTKGEVIARVDPLRNDGVDPNRIVLLPEWNKPAGRRERTGVAAGPAPDLGCGRPSAAPTGRPPGRRAVSTLMRG